MNRGPEYTLHRSPQAVGFYRTVAVAQTSVALPPMWKARSHNDLSEVLPVELMVKIFECMVETVVVRDFRPWKLYRSYRRWIQAAATCARWHKIAFTTPTLWRVIDVGSTGWALHSGLHFTDEIPVDITFHHPAPLRYAVQTLAENADRIKSLIVVDADEVALEALASLFQYCPMPALKELWINAAPHPADTNKVPAIRPEFVPSLQVAHFTHLRFDWGSPIIRNLRSLYLGYSPARGRFRIDDILSVLATCHRLEFLKIDQAFPFYGDDQAKLTIALPQLREIYLVANDPRVVHHLLSHIHFGPSINIDVNVPFAVYGVRHPFLDVDIADLFPQDTACIPLLQTATRATLKDLDFECWGPGGCGRLALSFDFWTRSNEFKYTISQHVQQFGDLLCNAPITELIICTTGPGDIPTVDLGRLLRNFPEMTSLEYSGLTTYVTDLFSLLTPRSSCEGSDALRPSQAPITILPKLRSLRMVRVSRTNDFIPRLRDCMRARYRARLILNDLYVEVYRPWTHDGGNIESRWREAEGELSILVRGSMRVRLL